MPDTPLESSTSGGDGSAKNSERLDTRDAAALLELMAELASQRGDSRRWRHEMLTRLVRQVSASAVAACTVKVDAGLNVVQVVSIFDVGFKSLEQRQAFLDEINDAPFQDPLSAKCLKNLFAGVADTLTAERRKVVDDAAWYSSEIVERYRQPANIDTCLISMQRAGRAYAPADRQGGAERQVMIVCAFRPWGDCDCFTQRDRIVLNTLHQGLAWMYHAETMLERLTRATSLTPRLRQTLEFLLAGDTERQVASKMRISIHTVHDYVKALYVHFGVSSRGELLARWIQSGESLPALRQDGE